MFNPRWCIAPAALLFVVAAAPLGAETGHEAWLRYAPIPGPGRAVFLALPAVVVSAGKSPVIESARAELIRGFRGMLGRSLRVQDVPGREAAFLLGAIADVRETFPRLPVPAALPPDAYSIKRVQLDGRRHILITGATGRGVLYGVFALLRNVALQSSVAALEETGAPYAPVRWVNHWDNLDGTIERGYGGRSLFFEGDHVRQDLSQVRDYARLLASIGINACAINNVNADPRVIRAEFLPQVARLAEAFRAWGVQIALSVDFSSPQRIGGLDTFDPLDPRTAAWWKDKVDEIYRAAPDLAGIVVKADSEGRLGPSAYGRTHADAANVIARALQPHGGLLFYRGFVYDHHMDWRNLKNDRARAACDNFIQLDGQFEDNAVIQIKHGPIDFQVREPASPLFGALEKTNQAIELQITQEYFGQARHLVFLVPMWKEALDFDLHAKGPGTPVYQLAAGKTFRRGVGGFVGVSNAGRDANWMGHPLSQANLYGFGRLAWNPALTSEQIADEWTRLTFGHDPQVVQVVAGMQLNSWRTYENYTGPLGAQTLTEITGNHYGPAVEASERNGWGQWHRADSQGIGMDRTVATGAGFIGQYRPAVSKVYESLTDCPDELLLFMHHVPYTYVLHSGATVIQHIYDTHYRGAAEAETYPAKWKSLIGRIDEGRYFEVLKRLEYQAGHAQVWRDAVNSWFLRTSGIADAQGRAGNYPGRTEAEQMRLEGYEPVDVQPWEAASKFRAVQCPVSVPKCTASFRYEGRPGWFDIDAQYFDQNNGVSRFRLFVNAQLVSEWLADDVLPPVRQMNAHSSTRHRTPGIALRPGDTLRVEAIPDAGERAGLDYIEVRPPIAAAQIKQ